MSQKNHFYSNENNIRFESQSTSVGQKANWKPSKGPESLFRSHYRVVCKPLEVSGISLSVQKRVHQYIDLKPLSEWSLSTLVHRPGLYVLNNILTETGQLRNEVYKNCGTRLRWTTIGNDYDWTNKVYAEKPRESLPEEITELASIVSVILRLPEMNADAVVLNYYDRKSNLSPHVDRSERDMSKPLISVSLGQSAIYLTGGAEVSDPVDALYLHSGDVLVMNADQRSVYHALPKILMDKKFKDGTGVDSCVIDYAMKCRMCVTIRQVD
uniref:Fe2OG dioxygenase domain-containing protein n=1 Tax=Ditylenchus dipsaci TaxID=166011 RepID=A0A915D0K9_9BILA